VTDRPGTGLGNDYSLACEPGVVRLCGSAVTLGEDVWIAVRPPSGHEGADDLNDDQRRNQSRRARPVA
jgi:hypothetical protein